MPKVLIAEDDEALQRMYATAFSRSGFEVTLAPSGAEALVRVEEQTFDIILLDMLMSGMSGLDFLRSYDVRVQSPGTKVIALSNVVNPSIEKQAYELGAIEYLYKSQYEPTRLIAHVQELLANTPPEDRPTPQNGPVQL